MARLAVSLVLAMFVVAAGAGAGSPTAAPIDLGGRVVQLVGAHGSLWVLTCDRRCGGEGRRSVGRVVRIDPRSGRPARSASLPRPGALAVGPRDVYATDFWRNALRRLDPRTLRVTATRRLSLPFRCPPAGDREFFPAHVGAAASGAWVTTARCAVARVGRLLRRVVVVRLPPKAPGDLAVARDAVWIAGGRRVYRIDPRTDRVVARIRIGRVLAYVSARWVALGGGRALAVGSRVRGVASTDEQVLARIDPRTNRVLGVTPLPRGRLAVAFGRGSLWVGRSASGRLQRIDPRTGQVVAEIAAPVGTALAVVGGRVWTAYANGTVRAIG
ncbi:MAG: hypothetical protein ICV64_04150 [Thermoleophilia bacterium]|nr:hypothetical protein [Thermoleophilia bacterium]